MRYLFTLLFLVVLITQISYGQNHAEKKFIRFAIGKDSITYNAKIDSGWINDVKQALSNDTLFDWKNTYRYEKGRLPDSLILVLTPIERAYVIHEFDKMKGFLWGNNVVKNSLAVDYVKQKAYQKEHVGEIYYNRDNYKNGSYAFGRPVFIRNKRVCFFYFVYRQGVYLKVYIKEKRKWELKFTPMMIILD